MTTASISSAAPTTEAVMIELAPTQAIDMTALLRD